MSDRSPLPYLDETLAEQALHQVAVGPQHASMVDADAVDRQLCQLPARRKRASVPASRRNLAEREAQELG